MEFAELSFRVNRDEFSDSVAWVARSLPSRPSIPVLGCVFIELDDQGLILSGFDYETSTRVRLGVETGSEGKVLVSGRLLAEITKVLPNRPVDVTVDAGRMHITCGSAKFTLPTMPIEDYPALPTMPEATGDVAPDLFSLAIAQVAVAAGKDDTLPMLTGIRMEIEGSQVVLAATDRFRLAVRSFEWTPQDDGIEAAVLVPAKTLSEAAKSTGSTASEPVELALGGASSVGAEGLLGIHTGTRRVTTRLLDSQFPPFRNLLPSTHTSMARVEVAPLTEAIRRVALVAERGAQIRMEFTEGSLRLTAGAEEGSSAEEILPVEFHGEDLVIAFNPGYLQDGLGALHSETVIFGFTQASRPAVLKPGADVTIETSTSGEFPALESDFTYLLMPVRLPG